MKRDVEEIETQIDADTPIYYVLTKTWNRNVIHGPHANLRARDMAVEYANSFPGGGPVEFIQLVGNLGRYRVRKGKGGKVLLEKQQRTFKVVAKP